MKNSFLITAILAAFFLSSCSEDEGEGTLNVKFNPTFNNQVLELNKNYALNGDSVLFTKVQFYVSNISTSDKDGNSTILVKDVDLIDVENNTLISYDIPEGSYKNFTIGMGLSDEMNGTDPSTYASDHPLSLDNSTYWMMANSYIFLKIEGEHRDNGVTTPVVYHIGKNGFYDEVNVDNKAYSIYDGNSTTILVDMEVDKLFDGLTLPADSETHTGNNLPLATQIMDNFVGSVSVK